MSCDSLAVVSGQSGTFMFLHAISKSWLKRGGFRGSFSPDIKAGPPNLGGPPPNKVKKNAERDERGCEEGRVQNPLLVVARNMGLVFFSGLIKFAW